MLRSALKFLTSPFSARHVTEDRHVRIDPNTPGRRLHFSAREQPLTPPGSPPAWYPDPSRALPQDDEEGVTAEVSTRSTEANGMWIMNLHKSAGSDQLTRMLTDFGKNEFSMCKAGFSTFREALQGICDDNFIARSLMVPTAGDGAMQTDGTRNFHDFKNILECFGVDPSKNVTLAHVQNFVACINGFGIRTDDSDPYMRRTPNVSQRGAAGRIAQSDFFHQAANNVIRDLLFKAFGKKLVETFYKEGSFTMQGRDEKTGELHGEGLLLLCRVLQIMKPSHLKVLDDAKKDFNDVKFDRLKHKDSSMSVLVSELTAAAADANILAGSVIITNSDKARRILELIQQSSKDKRLVEEVEKIYKKFEQGRQTYSEFLQSLREDTECILESKSSSAPKAALATDKQGDDKARHGGGGRGRGKDGRGGRGPGGRGGRGKKDRRPPKGPPKEKVKWDYWTYDGDKKHHSGTGVDYVWVDYTDHPDGTEGAYYHPNKVPPHFHAQMKKKGFKVDDSQRRKKSPKRKPAVESEARDTKKDSRAPSRMEVKRAFVTEMVSLAQMNEDEAADQFENGIGKQWDSSKE